MCVPDHPKSSQTLEEGMAQLSLRRHRWCGFRRTDSRFAVKCPWCAGIADHCCPMSAPTASLGLFALYPGIDSRDCFRVSGSCMRGWEAAMPTDSLFLLSQAVAVALMILLSGTAAAAGCLSAPNQAPAGRRTLVLSNEPRNERQVLVSSRTRCSDSGREAYAAAVKPILHSAR
jgi:hypothetical protein